MPNDLSADTIRKLAIWGIVMFLAIPLGGYYGLIYWGNGVAGAAVGLLVGAVLTALGLLVVQTMSAWFGALAGERKAHFTQREQLASDMLQVRHHKTNQHYDIALRKVNAILDADPDYPEALFLKAQIVWHGFGNRASAVTNLKKIHAIVDDPSSTVYRWAASLLEEIEQDPSSH